MALYLKVQIILMLIGFFLNLFVLVKKNRTEAQASLAVFTMTLNTGFLIWAVTLLARLH